MTKGLTTKWYVFIRDPREQERLGFYKADYAFDDDGRLWRRTYAEKLTWNGRQRWSIKTPWHIADPYTWFPAGSLTPPERSRVANTQARLPKTFERYIPEPGAAPLIVMKGG